MTGRFMRLYFLDKGADLATSVFVVHRGMQVREQHLDGHRYWKMRLTSIHKGEKRIWAVGVWFYSPSDLEELKLSKR